ncbi:Uncharacterized protein FWK35_00020465 [Aphis craccivora]|uniref:Uncharacterized protein n=1 Tax=Aphis craccivora TaxID=307492 RepID=A0A6G0YUF6_APHCR|nr:Uncharacterized protein FWK35_00020465 [Aphis craccivora]
MFRLRRSRRLCRGENSVNAVTGTNRSRRARDSHSVAGLRTITRVRHCSKFPAEEYPRRWWRRCPNGKHNYIAPRRALYGSAPGDSGGG